MASKFSKYLNPKKVVDGLLPLTIITAVLTLGVIITDYGFVLDYKETALIHKVYNAAWWIFFMAYIVRLVLEWKSIRRKGLFMTILMGALFLVTALPKIFPETGGGSFMDKLWSIFQSKFLIIALIGSYSFIEISRAVIGFINKKTNPALLMTLCFAIIITLGAFLLQLPRSTHEHIRLPIIDALFTATSAVCVTGLTTVDVPGTFTIEGQIIIAVLIQIGGLGVMTITSFFALFFMGGSGVYSQFALRDMLGSDTFHSLISTLLYILGFTFVIEAIGAFGLWTSIHGTMGMSLQEEIFFSVFHSISAFCNAGFSTLEGNLGNPAIMNGHSSFYLIISFLIILGGLGFPILMNLRRVLAYQLKKLKDKIFNRNKKRVKFSHLANINTKLVLCTTAALITIGTISLAFLEWNGAFAGMRSGEKIVHSFFNAVSPRTAGFNSVDLREFSFLSIMLYMFLMWIGGGAQSTAGGIKVNSFSAVVANFIAVVRGRSTARIFKREISQDSLQRASAVVFGSIITILIFFVTLTVLEPQMAPRDLLFETISAIGTVGSSLGITADLGADSKAVVSLLMFIGRVGLISVLMSFIKPSAAERFSLPEDKIIIN